MKKQSNTFSRLVKLRLIKCRISEKLYLDPDLYPNSTQRKLSEFIHTFRLRYEAQYPDPLKVLMGAAIEKWKLCNPEKKVNLDAYDEIRSS